MDKRGVVEEFVFWIVRVIVLGAIVFAITYLVNSNINTQLDTHDLGYDALMYRMLYSPICFTYQDAVTGRAYPGTVDYSLFNELQLSKCINSTSKNFGVMATLGERTIFLNKEAYEEIEPFRVFHNYFVKEISLPVNIMHGNEEKGKLEIIIAYKK